MINDNTDKICTSFINKFLRISLNNLISIIWSILKYFLFSFAGKQFPLWFSCVQYYEL